MTTGRNTHKTQTGENTKEGAKHNPSNSPFLLALSWNETRKVDRIARASQPRFPRHARPSRTQRAARIKILSTYTKNARAAGNLQRGQSLAPASSSSRRSASRAAYSALRSSVSSRMAATSSAVGDWEGKLRSDDSTPNTPRRTGQDRPLWSGSVIPQ